MLALLVYFHLVIMYNDIIVNTGETSLISAAPYVYFALISTDFIQFSGQAPHLSVEQQVRRADYLLFDNL